MRLLQWQRWIQAQALYLTRYVLFVVEFVHIDERDDHDHSSRPDNGSLVERTFLLERSARAGGSGCGQSFDLRFRPYRSGCSTGWH